MAIGRPPIILDKSRIIRLYSKGLSSQKIGPLFNVSWATINRRLKRWDIPIRYQYPIWNKGLTVDTDERVCRNSNKTSRMSGHIHTPETRLAMSRSRKGKNTWSKGSKKSELTRQRNSSAAMKLWRDPVYVSKVIAGLHMRPTRPEKQLKTILDVLFPEFQYNGDFSLGILLNGQIPDFVNINGRKEVIEVFGDYWHSPRMIGNQWKRTELGTIMAYNSVGYKCLVLWESELNTLPKDDIIRRIRRWIKQPTMHVSQKA